jgi:hypothetical protein
MSNKRSLVFARLYFGRKYRAFSPIARLFERCLATLMTEVSREPMRNFPAEEPINVVVKFSTSESESRCGVAWTSDQKRKKRETLHTMQMRQ